MKAFNDNQHLYLNELIIYCQNHKDSHLICRAPDLLVDLCHWQIQANDFVVY